MQQIVHDALLDMEAVFGLVEDNRAFVVSNFVGDLLAPMGREAVHEQAVPGGS